MQQSSDGEEETIRQVIYQCIVALRGWDRTTIARIFANDPHAIHFGTAADEKYIGGAAYIHAMEQQHIVSFPDVEFDFLPGSPAIERHQSVAWVVGDARLSGTGHNHRYFHIDTRLTFILKKLEQDWQIVHSHFSVGVPAPQ